MLGTNVIGPGSRNSFGTSDGILRDERLVSKCLVWAGSPDADLRTAKTMPRVIGQTAPADRQTSEKVCRRRESCNPITNCNLRIGDLGGSHNNLDVR